MFDAVTTELENTDLNTPSVSQQSGDTARIDQPEKQAEPMQDPSTSQDRAVSEASLENAQPETLEQLAAELKLAPEHAEKLAAFETAHAAHYAQQALEEKRRQTAAWASQTRARYGAGLEQEIAFALRAANTFGGPELRTLLEETGLGNHPVVIRTLSGIGRTISEDASLGGLPSAPQDKTFAEALYGKHN